MLSENKLYSRSACDDITIKAKKNDDEWEDFDEGWGFYLPDVPNKFRTKIKHENYLLARKEEEEKKTVLKSKPYIMVIEPTNICNLQCPLCSTGVGGQSRDKGSLNFENFKKLIDEAGDYLLKLALQNWGEPTLVKDLPKMIRYAADKGIFVTISSNFSIDYKDEYLEEFIKSGLGLLKIDIDGTTEEIYQKYRISGKLKTVIENTKRVVEIKKKHNLKYPIIQSKMLVMKHNEHQIEDFKKLSKTLDVDEIELGNIQLDPKAGKDWLPTNKKFIYETYLQDTEIQPCHWPWSGFVVNWDGGVTPCCIVDDSGADFGNIFKEGLMGVWNNEYYISARSEFSDKKEISKFTICNVCKNDTHNPKLFRVGDTFSITTNPDTKLNNKIKSL